MTPLEKDLYEKAERLKELEIECLRLAYDESIQPSTKEEVYEFGKRLWILGSEAFDIKNEILEFFVNSLNIQVFNDSVKEILNKIRNKEKFYSISFYEEYSQRVEKKSGESLGFAINFEQFLDAKYDEWYDDFYQKFHPIRYYKEIMTIGPIISSSRVPSEAIIFFDEVREAYALELYASATSLCRSILETSLFDKLNKIGHFKNSKVVNIDKKKKDKLYSLIIDSSKNKLLDKRTTDLANDIRITANRILHLKKITKKTFHMNKKDTFRIITNTIIVLEKLYS
jgi:hypothetical protein